MPRNKGVPKNRSTEDWLPIRAIQSGMIFTYANNKVTGVKITPRNIFILDAGAQDNILTSLKNFYNMIDFEFWLGFDFGFAFFEIWSYVALAGWEIPCKP